MKKIAWILAFALIVQLIPVNVTTTVAADTVTIDDSTVIDSSYIPDETLLNCIKNSIGKSTEDTVTYGDIKNISELTYPEDKTYELGWEPIESLEGIGILTSLSSLTVTGHNITDLTPLAEGTAIYSLWADDNKISKMPDFSGKSMSAFYVNRNRLSYETLAANMPSGWSWAVEDQAASQVSDTIETIVSDKTYEVLDADGNSYFPFIMESSDMRSSRDYTLQSVTVDGVTMTEKFELKSSNTNYGESPYVYVQVTEGDFMEKDKELAIKAVIADEYGETFTLETTSIMESYQDVYEINVDEAQYISTTGVQKTGIKLDDKQFMTKSQSVTVSKVELASQDGTVYGQVSSGQSYPPYGIYDYRYDNQEIINKCYNMLWTMIDDYSKVCQTSFYTYSSMNIRNELPEGFYDLVYTLSDGTKYIYKKAYEAVTRPIIYGIYDTEGAPGTYDVMITDQTGDYVSVYVYGWNISKDAVKPVFYNNSDEAISGDVAAVETDKWGGYFRIEKNNPNSADWVSPSGEKSYKVKVETEQEVFEKTAYIKGREIFYQYFDQRDKSYTVYLAQKADVDTTYSPTLSFETREYDYDSYEYKYIPFATTENGEFTESTNKLTGQKELKVKFTLTDEQIDLIKENEYSLYYSVEYKDSNGETCVARSDYMMRYALGNSYVDDVPEKGIFDGYSKNIMYLPYWIGGVYSIEKAGEESYYLTEDDVEALSDGKYAYANYWDDTVTMEEGQFTQRSSSYYFMKVGVPPVAPVGKPVLSVEKQSDTWKFNWTEVSGANGYNIWLKYGDAKTIFSRYTVNCWEIESEILPILFQEIFEECRVNPDESKMEIYVQALNVEDGVCAYGDNSNVFTVADIKSGNTNGNTTVHTHTATTQITKAKYGSNGSEKTVCSSCKETIKTTTIYEPKTVTAIDLTYNGKLQTPNVVVKDSKGNVIEASNYTVSTVKNVGNNNITITFKSSSKYYTGTMSATVKVNPKSTSISTVTGKKKSIVVKWKKQTAQTKGYQIQYATDKKFKKNVKLVTVKNNKKTSVTIKKLKAKKKYYVRIRTYKGKCYSSWSKSKSVKTK